MLTDRQGDTIMFDINLDTKHNDQHTGQCAGQHNRQHDNEMNSDMRDLILFAARPDACPNDLAGRQGVAPKPQAGDFVLAPAVSVLLFPLSPSAHTAGGDKRFGSRYAGSAASNANDNIHTDNTPSDNKYNDYSEQEDYDRSTIMGSFNNSGTGDTCGLVAANLSAYQDGELDSDETRLVAAHVGKCPRCAEIFETLQQTDAEIEREWRESAPLPSSLRYEQAVNSVMAALPAAPVQTPTFAPRRVHARARWTRFASGMAAVIVLAVSLWTSYQLGYTRGRSSVSNAAPSSQPQSLSSQLPHSLSTSHRTAHVGYSRPFLLPPAPRIAPAPSFAYPAPRIISALTSSSLNTFSAPSPYYASMLPRVPLRHSQPHP